MMERLLLKGVLLDGRTRNILIEDKRFKDLDAPVEVAEAKILDASGTAILPALYNTHTHAAMTLLRGYADDMPLMKWLQEYIWPFEEKLTPEDVRHGSEIAIKEMVQSGTVFFNDMYFDVEETIDAVDRTG
ncbi:MAG: amidohydrolase family protein, partial [Bacteroidales bacterium]|nr:amidohydrolase family protein [Bacteroidales bacterium]